MSGLAANSVSADEAPGATAPTAALPSGDELRAALEAQVESLKQVQQAIASQLLNEYPDDFDALRVMDYVDADQGDVSNLIRRWRKCFELRPDSGEPLDQLARHFAGVEEYAKAIELWYKALEVDDRFPELHRRIGEALLALERVDEAQAYAKAAIAADQRDGLAYYLLGQTLHAQGDLRGAKASFLQATRERPSDVDVWRALATICRQLDEEDDAANYQAHLQQLQPSANHGAPPANEIQLEVQRRRKNLARTCVDAGKVYAREKLPDRAAALWKRASRFDQQDVASRQLLAELHLERRQVREALRQFDELTEIDPDDPEHWRQVGFLQARLGRIDEAETAFGKIISMAPQSGVGYRSLAKLFLNTKREPQRALELAAKATELEPVADSYFVLGWSLAVNGNREQAAAPLEKATELDPENATYRKLLEMVRPK
ncbi:MAG: tetratricopeptide repeat protein [Planctomycetota bacterium]